MPLPRRQRRKCRRLALAVLAVVVGNTLLLPILLLVGYDASNNRSRASMLPPQNSRTATSTDRRLWLTLQDYDHRRNDVYAAAWWQSTVRFRGMMDWIVRNSTRGEGLIKLEAACHLAVEYNPEEVRLTTDWMAMSVEHLSKWWKAVRYQKHATAFETILQRLVDYIVLSLATKPSLAVLDDTAWKDTVAVVAYSPLQGPRSPERAQQLDIVVLAATLSSLIRHGVGRVVVVMEQGKLDHVESQIWPFVAGWLRYASRRGIASPHTKWETAWRAMLEQQQPAKNRELTFCIHDTAVVLWPVDTRVRDKRGQMQTRVPRQALLSLYEAIKAQPETDMLGPHNWKYVYYTEQDSLLHATTKNAPWQRQVLDQNGLLLPHRWQPMPHASDFLDDNNKDLPDSFYVPATKPWDLVYELDVNSNLQHCCDTGTTIRFAKLPCNDYWYLCGLGAHASDGLDHLRNFTLIRLRQGSQLTLLSASEHARTCLPSQTPCG